MFKKKQTLKPPCKKTVNKPIEELDLYITAAGYSITSELRELQDKINELVKDINKLKGILQIKNKICGVAEK